MNRISRLQERLLVAARRRVVRSDWLNRHLPWPLWCEVAAADSLAVAWVIARRAGRPLTFVEIGANDGVSWDPVHPVVKAYGWSGLLVEPIPALYERLLVNYAGVPNLQFENAAIGPRDGTATIYAVDPRPEDKEWVGLLTSFERHTILSHEDILPDVAERIVEVQVNLLTLRTLVSRHNVTSIDLLIVDTEGYDYEILKQIEFSSSWAPSLIIYEREHFDRSTDRAARRLLHNAGYRLAKVRADMLAYRVPPERLGGNQGQRRRRSKRSE